MSISTVFSVFVQSMNQATACSVSPLTYSQIQKGMIISDVQKMIGCQGIIREMYFGPGGQYTYEFQGDIPNTTIYIYFDHDKVVGKSRLDNRY